MGHNQGFTLIEMIIVMGLLSIILVVFAGVWRNINQDWDNISGQIELQQNLRWAMEAIIQDLQDGRTFEIVDKNCILITNIQQKKIQYELDVDPQADEHIFSLAGKVLYRSENSGKREPIANFIQELNLRSSPHNSSLIDVQLKGLLPSNQDFVLVTGVEMKWINF